jgi:hypothetical protein
MTFEPKGEEAAPRNLLEDLAALCEEMIGDHPDILSYTPRRIIAFGALFRRRQAREDRLAFMSRLTAARGEPEAVREFQASLCYGNDSVID